MGTLSSRAVPPSVPGRDPHSDDGVAAAARSWQQASEPAACGWTASAPGRAVAYCVWVPSTASLDPGLKNRDSATRTKKGHGRPADGKALEVEERYSQHLGGELHGQPCRGDSCPVVRSRRSVDAKSGMMFMEIERTILSGETVKTKTYYSPAES